MNKELRRKVPESAEAMMSDWWSFKAQTFQESITAKEPFHSLQPCEAGVDRPFQIWTSLMTATWCRREILITIISYDFLITFLLEWIASLSPPKQLCFPRYCDYQHRHLHNRRPRFQAPISFPDQRSRSKHHEDRKSWLKSREDDTW